MLVLTRRIGEQVVINKDVIVTVLGTERGKVRLGFDAPESVPIWRKEIQDPQPKPESK